MAISTHSRLPDQLLGINPRSRLGHRLGMLLQDRVGQMDNVSSPVIFNHLQSLTPSGQPDHGLHLRVHHVSMRNTRPLGNLV